MDAYYFMQIFISMKKISCVACSVNLFLLCKNEGQLYKSFVLLIYFIINNIKVNEMREKNNLNKLDIHVVKLINDEKS